MRISLVLLGALSIGLAPSIAYANFIWPPMYYLGGYAVWWVICVGLLIEFFAYLKGFNLTVRQAIFATVTMNVASAIAGVIFCIGGLIFVSVEFLAIAFMYAFVPLIFALTVAIEYYYGVSQEDFPKGRRTLLIIAAANVPSVGLAIWQGVVLFNNEFG